MCGALHAPVRSCARGVKVRTFACEASSYADRGTCSAKVCWRPRTVIPAECGALHAGLSGVGTCVVRRLALRSCVLPCLGVRYCVHLSPRSAMLRTRGQLGNAKAWCWKCPTPNLCFDICV